MAEKLGEYNVLLGENDVRTRMVYDCKKGPYVSIKAKKYEVVKRAGVSKDNIKFDFVCKEGK
jgi:hypothetical protein